MVLGRPVNLASILNALNYSSV